MAARHLMLILVVLSSAMMSRTTLKHRLHRKHKHQVSCPNLKPSRHGRVSCHKDGLEIGCDQKLPAETVADFRCDLNYVAKPSRIVECLSNGSWSSPPAECVPDCGKRSPFVTLILNGRVVAPGTYPWHAAIFNFVDGKYDFWCGGSLISEYSVITAAHCVWNVEEKNLVVAVGKFLRDFEAEENGMQKIGIARVEMLSSYQDIAGNYNGDLSVIFLKRAVRIDAFARPVCIDWNQDHVDKQLADGNLGTVLGWGLTEKDELSEVLKLVQIPVRSDDSCIAQLQRDFRKFVTYTSFCAGFRNGSGVCNGDSGGGLSFADHQTDTWYLQGVVSVSPRRRGTSFCDPDFYTVFTKVTIFLKWLLQMKSLEKDLLQRGIIDGSSDETSPSDLALTSANPSG